ncbi:MAG: OmpA family protein [Pseudomonadota bacterium]
MTKQDDTYEMVDIATTKRSWRKTTSFVVLGVISVGALMSYYLVGRVPVKNPVDSKYSIARLDPSPANTPSIKAVDSVAPAAESWQPAKETLQGSNEKITEKITPQNRTITALPTTAATEPAKESYTPIGENPTQPISYQNASVVNTTPPSPISHPERISETVHFAFNKAEPLLSEYEKLQAFSAGIRNSSGTVIIEGHSDSLGIENYNKELSVRRAVNVGRILRQQGVISQHKLTIKGNGISNPIGSNTTREGRYANRRTVISFVPDTIN